MLSQDERRQFDAIARRLSADPELHRHLTPQGQAEDRPLPVMAVLFATLYIMLPLLMLLGGWTAVLPTLGAFVLALAAVALRRRSRRPRPMR